MCVCVLYSVFKNWWARKMVTTLSAEEQEIMRVELLAHRFAHGKKEGFAIARDSYNMHHADASARQVHIYPLNLTTCVCSHCVRHLKLPTARRCLTQKLSS